MTAYINVILALSETDYSGKGGLESAGGLIVTSGIGEEALRSP